MLSVSGGCAAGVLAGFDAKLIYIATASHITDMSSRPFALGESQI